MMRESAQFQHPSSEWLQEEADWAQACRRRMPASARTPRESSPVIAESS
jgi:hypothetical protein